MDGKELLGMLPYLIMKKLSCDRLWSRITNNWSVNYELVLTGETTAGSHLLQTTMGAKTVLELHNGQVGKENSESGIGTIHFRLGPAPLFYFICRRGEERVICNSGH